MQNKIPCAAQQLNQLEPAVIQSVAEVAAFTVGNQYLLENRVRILEADDVHISAAVVGNSGLYKQTIWLRAGSLVMECTCPLGEQPFCRHCVAVLLEYHQSDHSRAPSAAPDRRAVEEPPSEPEETASGLGLTLREVTIFIDWLQPAIKALERGQELPGASDLKPGEVLGWVQAIQKLQERWHRSDEKQRALETDLHARETQLAQVTQQLEASKQEATKARTECEKSQRELDSCRGTLTRLAEMARELDLLDGQIRSMAGDIINKGSMLDGQAASLKEVSAALHALSKPPAQ
jgi:uncharacterized Zn finger protein